MTKPSSWLFPATPADWAIRVLTVAVVVMLGAALVMWDAVQDIETNQEQARIRGCLMLAGQGVSDAELARVGCVLQ